MLIDVSDENNPLQNKDFINDSFLPKAIKLCSNPKLNLSEAGAFMFLVIFNKYLHNLNFEHSLLPKCEF